MNKRLHLTIFGDVTGVGFRSFVLSKAKQQNLTGWVRNIDKGKVEAVFEGEEDKLDKILQLCCKGPETSYVKEINLKWFEATGEFQDFRINLM